MPERTEYIEFADLGIETLNQDGTNHNGNSVNRAVTVLDEFTIIDDKQQATDKEPFHDSEVDDPLLGIVPGYTRIERYTNFTIHVLDQIWPHNSQTGENREYNGYLWAVDEFKYSLYNLFTQIDTHTHVIQTGNDKPEKEEGINSIDGHNEFPLNQDGFTFVEDSVERPINGFIHFNGNAVDPRSLSAKEFESMVESIGSPDYLRIRAVDPRGLEENGIVTGGSCVLETRLMTYLTTMNAALRSGDSELTEQKLSEIEDLFRTVVNRGIAMTPTVTQISGAGLYGQGINKEEQTINAGVLYEESDMWKYKIGVDFNMPSAAKTVDDVYKKIREAVKRRALLINSQAVILPVNFDELELETQLEQWNEKMHLEPTEKLGLQDVIATYISPQARQRLQTALTTQIAEAAAIGEEPSVEELAAQAIIRKTRHDRIKQIDHGGIESIPLPIHYIIGLRDLTTDENAKMIEDNPYKVVTTILRHTYLSQVHDDPDERFLGFADLPGYRNSVAHKDHTVKGQFTGKPGDPEFQESVMAALNNPAYLNATNVDTHLAYLRSYTIDVGQERSRLILEKKGLEPQVKIFTKAIETLHGENASKTAKLEKYKATIAKHEAIIEAIDFLTSTGKPEELSERQRSGIMALQDQILSTLSSINKRGIKQELTSKDNIDLVLLPSLHEHLQHFLETGRKPVLPVDLHSRIVEFRYNAKSVLEDPELHTEKTEIEIRLKQIPGELELIEKDEQYISLQAQARSLNEGLERLKLDVWPLSENPFVQHAMMFLFDSDFPAFLIQAVVLQQKVGQISERRKSLERDIYALERVKQPDFDSGKNLLSVLKEKLKQLRQTEQETKVHATMQLKSLMGKLYPKLEAYINFIYSRTDEYPAEIRNKRLILV